MMRLLKIFAGFFLLSTVSTVGRRTRRSIFDRYAKNPYPGRTCNMHIQADHKLFEEILRNEGDSDPTRTRELIVNMINIHVKAVNEIYESTDFNDIHGINFAVKRITIYTQDQCNSEGLMENPFCEDNLTAAQFLDRLSRQNHSAFCLSYALTYRDFEGAAGAELGMAWEARPVNSAGGICHVHQQVNNFGLRSLNTGIVTLKSKGERVPPRVAQLTLAHEIGHNLGAPHDFPADCQPGMPDGNFLMHSASSSGDAPNNARFSRCAVGNISAVLGQLLRLSPNPSGRGARRNCFTDDFASFCGDGVLAADEQCDCGFSDKDCQLAGDKCCHSRENKYRFKGCTRKPGASCSPSEGACCNPANCQFHVSAGGKECAAESECSYLSTCDGISAKCPIAMPKDDGLTCEDATKVCRQGTCSGSVCEQVGLKDCNITDVASELLCYLALCISTLHLPEFVGNRTRFTQKGREGLTGILLLPGSPCNNGTEKCDMNHECKSNDEEGVIQWIKSIWRDSSRLFSNIKSFFS